MTEAGEFTVFRPRRARAMALTLMGCIGLGGLVFALAVPGFHLVDRVGTLLVVALIAGFLYRQATVRATPSAQGLHVRNLLRERRLEWAEILGVRLGDNPWVVLDLSDGDTLSVMGIQRSDGVDHAQAEARRLLGLVEQHSGPLSSA